MTTATSSRRSAKRTRAPADDPVTAYARAVDGGRVLAGHPVRQAGARHLRDLAEGPARGLRWDAGLADRAIDFFTRILRLAEGQFADQPFVLQPWQAFIVGSLFGWLGPDGFRRFRTAYIEAGKGSGKTPLLGGLGLYGLLEDGEAAAEIYAAAVTRDQAGILFRDARRMAAASPALARRLDILEHNLADPASDSFFRAVSSEANSLDGKRVHMALIDEIHEHPSAMVVDKMRAGTKGRRQALIVEITNALALQTPIPTPTGWTTMGQVQIGDRVFDEEGRPCRVTGTSAIATDHQCYRLTFDDGSEIIADAGHLWQTRFRRSQVRTEYLAARNTSRRENTGQRRQRGESNPRISCSCECGGTLLRFDSAGRRREHMNGHNTEVVERVGVRTTQQIKDTLQYWGRASNHSIAMASPLVLPRADLPVDPYVLGVWLGDGNSKDSAIIVHDTDLEILGHIEAAGVSVGRRRAAKGKKALALYGLGVTGRGRRDSLHCDLKRLGVLRNKHIPNAYLRGSVHQRLSLLQGLMDTDGSVAPRSGRCVFTQAREALARQAGELVASLGIKYTLLKSRSPLRGKLFTRWDVFFYPPWDMQPFRLKRKLRFHHQRHDRRRMSATRMIVAVEPVDSVPARCIAVDSPSRLFLAGVSMVPTHNSGYDRHSVCWQHHDYSLKILEGGIDNDAWFAYVCTLDPCAPHRAEGHAQPAEGCEACDQWTDERTWGKANPNLDISVTRKYLREQVAEAQGMPAKESLVRRLNFCTWTSSVTRWLSADVWAACAGPLAWPDLPAACLGRRAWLGLDLSSTSDLTAAVLLLPDDADGYDVIPYCWLPEERLQDRVRRDRVPYDQWAREGALELTPGNVVDYAVIRARLGELAERYDLAELAYDPWSATGLVTQLQEDGATCVPIRQGFQTLSAPTKELEKLVGARALRHGGHPVLAWCAANVVVQQDPAGNLKPSKVRSTERIDGISAMVTALARAMVRSTAAVPRLSLL